MSSIALKATRDKSAFPGKQYPDAEVLKKNPQKTPKCTTAGKDHMPPCF